MTDTSRTHRCIDCKQQIEHTPSELCYSCGRCDEHCLCPERQDPPARQAQRQLEIQAGTKTDVEARTATRRR